MLSTAEMACLVLVVALAAQRGHLALHPLLAWQSVGRSAPVAEPTRQQPTIDAWALEQLLGAPCDHPQLSHGAYTKQSAMGGNSANVNVCWSETNGYEHSSNNSNSTSKHSAK